ncbi:MULTISPECIES: class I SAM-dependent methyltransferase [unclassified Sinorhizobium]|uniref:class I SAM-dependent methyltransferase n=1 Tax=unclassified Sinorhizobium TaxID=2613772 RepID=UPI003525439D
MPDAIYIDPRLVLLYDILNPAGADTDFYLRAARPGSRILDIGCGTGLLTRLFAAAGHRATGLDPAAAMLDVARANDRAGTVHWIEADARAFSLGERFDLITMTGHVFQVFGASEGLQVLQNAHAHLEDGGRLIFESRNPAARPWEEWTPGLSAKTIRHDDIGDVDIHHRLLSVRDDLVAFETIQQFRRSGETLTSRSTLQFPTKNQIESQLPSAGFSDVVWLGDWQGGSWSPMSREIIAVARR